MFRIYFIIFASFLITITGHTLEVITSPVELGEGTFWDAERQILYFVDITNSTINSYDPATKQHHKSQPIAGDGKVTFIIPIAGHPDWYVISTGLEIRLVQWDGIDGSEISTSRVLVKADQEPGSRFNDAKVDYNGILWAGTMGPEPIPTQVQRVNSKLFTMEFKDGEFQLIPRIEDIYISNGLDWNKDNTYMYWTDTGKNTIEGFDYNLNHPNIISNRCTIYDFNANDIAGKTDGFTMDTEGNLYLACYGGYQVIVVNPTTKQIIDRIYVPAGEVTTLAFGGANMNDLYITTSKKGANSTNLQEYPNTGALFRVANYKAYGYPGNPLPYFEAFKINS